MLGNIDFIVNTHDFRVQRDGSNGGGLCGIHDLDIEIRVNGSSEAWISYINFDNIPEHSTTKVTYTKNSCAVGPTYCGKPADIEYYATHDPFNAPHDRFFNSRQRKGGEYNELTTCPLDALFSESNNVDLVAWSCDYTGICANDNQFIEDLRIDNFQPFVSEVSCYFGNSEVYYAAWVCASSCGGVRLLTDNRTTEISYEELESGLEIRVETSERMQHLNLTIDNSLVQGMAGDADPNSAGKVWTFNITMLELLGIHEVQMEFSGIDANDNMLLMLDNFQNSSCVSIPYRIGTLGPVNWANPNNVVSGLDRIHVFEINCGPPPSPFNGNTETFVVIPEEDCFENGGIDETIQSTSGPLAMDGSISISLFAGIAPYKYIWDTGESTPTIGNLGVGQYCVTIEDAYCCKTEQCYDVESECPELIEGIDNWGFIKCEGDKGQLSVVLSGEGEPPITFLWSTGSTSQSIGLLEPNQTYTVTVTDANGCESTESVFMEDHSIPTIITADIVDACGDQKGSIDLTVLGGDPFNFEWNDGHTAEDRDQLAMGNYCVTITDVNNCEKSECFDVGGAGFEIILDKIKHRTICAPNQPCDGEISITPYPSTFNFSYSWIGLNSGFQSNEEDISDLCEDSYKLVVTDNASGCSATKWFFICCCDGVSDIPSPCEDLGLNNPIYIDPVDVTIPSGSNNNDGAIDITAWGGGDPKYFSWEGPNGFRSNEEDISGLAEGNYCVTVSDGCKEAWTCRLIRSCETIMGLITSSQDDACSLMSPDGSIELEMPTTNYSFSFQWSNGTNEQNAYNLLPGLYSVTVTETNLNCEAILEFEIGIIDQLEIISEVLQHACAGESNGSISLDYAPKRPEDDAYWDDEPWNHGYQRSDLMAGTYCISIHNKCGYLRKCYTLNNSEINVDFEYELGCPPDNEIKANISGDNPPFTYTWSNGATTETISGIEYGKYKITVTDKYGCEIVREAELDLIDILEITHTCEGFNDGSITIKINNPTGNPIDVLYTKRPCYDCELLPIIEGATHNPITLTFNNLIYGHYKYFVRIYSSSGICMIPIYFTIKKLDTHEVYAGHEFINDVLYCNYDIVCDDYVLNEKQKKGRG